MLSLFPIYLYSIPSIFRDEIFGGPAAQVGQRPEHHLISANPDLSGRHTPRRSTPLRFKAPLIARQVMNLETPPM